MGLPHNVIGVPALCKVGDVVKKMHIYQKKLIFQAAKKGCYFVFLTDMEEKKSPYLQKRILRKYLWDYLSSNLAILEMR